MYCAQTVYQIAGAGDRKARLLERSSQSHAHNFIIIDEKYPNIVHLMSLIGTIGGYSLRL